MMAVVVVVGVWSFEVGRVQGSLLSPRKGRLLSRMLTMQSTYSVMYVHVYTYMYM